MTKGTFAMSLALAMTCGVAQAQTAERAGLKWTLKEGETLHYAISSATETALKIGDAMTLTDSNTLSTYTVTQTVSSVGEDGSAVIEAKVTSVKINNVVKSPMGAQKMAYDSANDEGDPMLRVMRHAVGKTFTFKISALGKVTGVAGGAEIRAVIAKAAEEELAQAMGGMGGGGMGGGGMGGGGMGGGMGVNPAMAARMAAEQLTAIFADEVIESTLTSLFNVLPEGAKAEGESWTSPSKLEQRLLGTIEYTTKYTHGGSVGDQVRIKISMDGEFKVSPPKAGAGGAGGGAGMMQMIRMMMKDLKIKSATVEGAATFGKGKLSDSELNRSLEAEGPLPPMLAMQFGGGQGGGGEEPQMTLSTKTKLRCEIQDAAPASKTPSESDGEKEAGGKDRSF